MPRKNRTDWPPHFIVFEIVCPECETHCWANKKTAVYCCSTCRVHAHENRVTRKERDPFGSEEPALLKPQELESASVLTQESRKSVSAFERPNNNVSVETISRPHDLPRYSVAQMKAMERPILTEGYVEVRPKLETPETTNIRYCALVDRANKIKGRLTSLDELASQKVPVWFYKQVILIDGSTIASHFDFVKKRREWNQCFEKANQNKEVH